MLKLLNLILKLKKPYTNTSLVCSKQLILVQLNKQVKGMITPMDRLTL
jgi:hypothetical protein